MLFDLNIRENFVHCEITSKYVLFGMFQFKNCFMWLKARFSTIDFDYMGYLFLQFDEHKKCKEEVLSLTHNYLVNDRILSFFFERGKYI
jgi:hypothetical protein